MSPRIMTVRLAVRDHVITQGCPGRIATPSAGVGDSTLAAKLARTDDISTLLGRRWCCWGGGDLGFREIALYDARGVC